ncbi:MAG: class I SAM-dependent methyltransferase [Myxococcota bacterium]
MAVDAGFDVTAVELVPESAENIRQLAVERPRLTAIQGDFYTVPLDGRFDVVCYWDGFGVGTDDDQRRLLRRIADEWLTDDGVALIDIYTPWSAAKSAGYRQKISELAHRTYDYDASGGRWLDIWTDGQQTVRQSLRCYSPPDLALLLEGTGLSLMSVTPGGGMDWAARTWHDAVPLVQAMMFTVRLSRINSRP